MNDRLTVLLDGGEYLYGSAFRRALPMTPAGFVKLINDNNIPYYAEGYTFDEIGDVCNDGIYEEYLPSERPIEIRIIEDIKFHEIHIRMAAEKIEELRPILQKENSSTAHGFSINGSKELSQCVTATQMDKVKAESGTKSATVTTKRLPVTQKVAAKLCGVTERQIGKWDKGIQKPDRYPGRHDLAVLTSWAETYKQGKLVASAARAANHPSTAEGWMLESLSDDGSGDPAAVLEKHEQNQNRRRKL